MMILAFDDTLFIYYYLFIVDTLTRSARFSCLSFFGSSLFRLSVLYIHFVYILAAIRKEEFHNFSYANVHILRTTSIICTESRTMDNKQRFEQKSTELKIHTKNIQGYPNAKHT